MQSPNHLAACLALALTALLAGPALAQSNSDASGGGRMLVLGGEAAQQRADSVVVLRGSAIGPRQAAHPAMAADRLQLIGGQRLWLVDPASGEVVSCRSRGTSNVGERIVACTRGSLPRHFAD